MKRTLTVLAAAAICAAGVFAGCGSTGEEPPAHTHDWGEWQVSIPATCTQKGEERRVCKTDNSHVETKETAINPDAHNWGEWNVITPADCLNNGVEERVCLNDDSHTETRKGESAFGHVLNEGETSCAKCGEPITDDASYYGFELNEDEQSYTIVRWFPSNPYNKVIIPKTYNGLPVTVIDSNEYNYSQLADYITEIYIPDSVTTIGGSAFKRLPKVTHVTIPDSVTTIDGAAFLECTGLESIAIPDNVTYIGHSAFDGCTALADVTMPDADISIERFAFRDTAIFNSPEKRTDGVLYIDNHLISADKTVRGDYSIKPGTKSVAERAFEDCAQIKSITMPDGLIGIDHTAFRGCTGLESIVIPDSVKRIDDDAFNIDYNNYGYTNITTATMPIFAARYLNRYSKSLKTVTLTSGTKTDGSDLFTRLPIESVTLPETLITIDGSSFSSCKLSEVVIPASVTEIGMFALSGCPLKKVTFAQGSALKKIDSCAFTDCTPLTDIIIPAGVTEIGHDAFAGCTSLKSVTFENPDGWQVSQNADMSGGQSVELSSPTQNAVYFTDKNYYVNNYYWKRG